jgi:hypothetical protein
VKLDGDFQGDIGERKMSIHKKKIYHATEEAYKNMTLLTMAHRLVLSTHLDTVICAANGAAFLFLLALYL